MFSKIDSKLPKKFELYSQVLFCPSFHLVFLLFSKPANSVTKECTRLERLQWMFLPSRIQSIDLQGGRKDRVRRHCGQCKTFISVVKCFFVCLFRRDRHYLSLSALQFVREREREREREQQNFPTVLRSPGGRG